MTADISATSSTSIAFQPSQPALTSTSQIETPRQRDLSTLFPKKQSRQDQKSLRERTITPLSVADTTTITDFTREAFIFSGTFGKVSRYHLNGTKEQYAIKQMQKGNLVKQGHVHQIAREVSLQRTFNHPFIVTLHKAFQDDDFIYLVLDHIPGGELFSYTTPESSLSIPQIRLYAAEIILALEYMHQKNIIYRDLKPENLLIDSDGHIKVCDFGFAKQLENDDKNQRTYTVCGTPEYLAPEIICRSGHNRAVDLWSLGILLYELFCGYPPFSLRNTHKDSSKNMLDLYNDIVQKPLAFPKGSKARNPELVKLIQSLLKKTPHKRLGMEYHPNDESLLAGLKQHPFFRGVDWKKVEQKQPLGIALACPVTMIPPPKEPEEDPFEGFSMPPCIGPEEKNMFSFIDEQLSPFKKHKKIADRQ